MDEVHERHIATDMLLGMLKLVALQRPDFRLIIMSATMDPQLYIDFFNRSLGLQQNDIKNENSNDNSVPIALSVNVITVPGRTYPVTSKIFSSSSSSSVGILWFSLAYSAKEGGREHLVVDVP